MTAFVLGATGLVGREVVRQLCVRATRAVAHVRPDSPKLAAWRERFAALGAEVDAAPWDALSGALRAAQPAQLYILIGTTKRRARADGVEGDIYEAVDLRLTQLAVGAAVASGVRPRLVYLSSVGADPHARSAYMRARGKAEAVVTAAGLPWVIARPSLIVGEREDDGRPLERAAAAAGDGLLAVAGLFGARRVRDRYRSTTPDVLASALIRIGEAPKYDVIAEGDELR